MCRTPLLSYEKALLLLIFIIIALSGCGQSDNYFTETVNTNSMEVEFTEQKDDENVINIPQVEDGETNEQPENLPQPLDVPVNTREEDIHYRSEDDIDPLRAMRRCKSDGENVYLVYGEPDLYVMPLGADTHNQMNIDNPEGLDVCNIAMDTYGRIHLLMADSNGEKSLIWRLDENHEIDKVIDISACLEVKQMPGWFLIDKDGTYYLQWTINRDGVIIDSEGELRHRFTPKSLGTGWIYQAAVGKDGQIYLLHSEQGDKINIDRLDAVNGSIIKEDSPLYFPGDEVFSAMACGTDTNLLVFSPYSGAWAYDQENGVMENRVLISDIDFGSDTEFWPLAFLADGRLLLLGKTGNDNCLKYISVGK